MSWNKKKILIGKDNNTLKDVVIKYKWMRNIEIIAQPIDKYKRKRKQKERKERIWNWKWDPGVEEKEENWGKTEERDENLWM